MSYKLYRKMIDKIRWLSVGQNTQTKKITPYLPNIKQTATRPAAFFAAILFTFSLTGCANTDSYVKEELADTAVSASTVNDSSGTNLFGIPVAYLNGADMFTERDKEIGYDDSTATVITLADNASASNQNNVSINDNNVIISEEGTYVLSGTLNNGMIIVDANDTDKIQLVLDDAEINCDTSAAIYIKEADKVFLTLASGSVNTLSNSGEFIAIDDNNIDSVIFSKSDLTLNGNGSLMIQSAYGHGIVSKDNLKIAGGTYDITAASSALSGKDSVRIADGIFSLHTDKDGIHSENEETADKGFIYIADGTFTIDCGSDGLDASSTLQVDGGNFSLHAGDDGFHADGDLIINDGDVIIHECYEGLEGQTVTVNGGNISLNSSDDGLNASDGNGQGEFGAMAPGPKDGNPFSASNDCCIIINGGTLYITADGDGIDSNGSFAVTGGSIYVSGPTDNGNSALDYDGSALITGGIVVATGSSQMAQNFGEDSTQGSILVTLSSQASPGEAVTLTDSTGKELIACLPEKAYNSVVISCPEIVQGETYTLTAGSQSYTIEMDSLIYGSGFGFGGGDRFGGERPDFGGNPPDFGDNPPDFSDNPSNFRDNDSNTDWKAPDGNSPDFKNNDNTTNRQMPSGNPTQFPNNDRSRNNEAHLDGSQKER